MRARLEDAATPADCAVLDMRYENPVRFRGRLFPSAENAYQSSRFSDPAVSGKFQYLRPDTAAYRGAYYRTTVPGWDDMREDVLREVLDAKFSDPDMRLKLKSTGLAPIVLVNFRHENELGSCACPKCRMRGRNMAGAVLERIRAAI